MWGVRGGRDVRDVRGVPPARQECAAREGRVCKSDVSDVRFPWGV